MMSFDRKRTEPSKESDIDREAARKRVVEYLRSLPDADKPAICEGFPDAGGRTFSSNQLADCIERSEPDFEDFLDSFIRVEIRYGELTQENS